MKTAFLSMALATSFMIAPAAFAAGDAAAGLQAMKERNVIVLENMHSMQEVEGKTFVGGNLTGIGQFGIGNAAQGQGASNNNVATLAVVGDALGNGHGSLKIANGPNGSNGTINNPASLHVGGNLDGYNLQGNAIAMVGGSASGSNELHATTSGLGAGFTAGLTAERDALESNLKALSLALSGLAATGGGFYDRFAHENNGAGSTKWALDAVAGDAGFAVAHISADDFFSFTELAYNFTPGLATIVNITGSGNYTWNINPVGGNAAHNPYIIYHFADATGLDIHRQVNGSILAPFANITNSTSVDGTIVARNLTLNGEAHLGNFGGNIDLPSQPAPGIPEPATWAMLISGFGLVGLAMRRRRGISTVSA